MTARELDARVAREVLGRTVCISGTGELVHLVGGSYEPLPTYITDPDPTADYSVLEHVRETWGCNRGNLTSALWDIWRPRFEKSGWKEGPLDMAISGVVAFTEYYHPGDIARAALAVVEAKEKADDPQRNS